MALWHVGVLATKGLVAILMNLLELCYFETHYPILHMNGFITSGIDHVGNIGLLSYAVSKYEHIALHNTLKSLLLAPLSL